MLKSKTYIAVPPGATISEQLADRGITQKEFSSRMGLSESHVSELLHGDVRLTPDMAVRLESVLGVPAQFWNNLEDIYRDKLARIEQENSMDAVGNQDKLNAMLRRAMEEERAATRP